MQSSLWSSFENRAPVVGIYWYPIVELQWLDFKIGHQDSSPSKGQRDDMPYSNRVKLVDHTSSCFITRNVPATTQCYCYHSSFNPISLISCNRTVSWSNVVPLKFKTNSCVTRCSFSSPIHRCGGRAPWMDHSNDMDTCPWARENTGAGSFRLLKRLQEASYLHMHVCAFPADTLRNNVIITSKRRRDVVLT